MSITVGQQTMRAFLEAFFAEGNLMHPVDAIHGSTLKDSDDAISVLLDDLNRTPSCLILPRKYPSGRLAWYAMARSSREFRALRMELYSFVGPTYSLFQGQSAMLDLNDPVDAVVATEYGKNVFVINVLESDAFSKVATALHLMRSVLMQRPAKMSIDVRPLSYLLRDFEFALKAGNEESAHACLSDLRSTGLISFQNLIFLNFRLLIAFSYWGDILKHAHFEDVISIRRPMLVTQGIVKAVYIETLLRFEKANDPEGALNHFRNFVVPKYKSLFRSFGAMKDIDVMKAFMINAISENPPRIDFVQRTMEDFSLTENETEYINAVLSLVSHQEIPSQSDPFESAKDAFNHSDFDTAFIHLQRCKLNVNSMRMLLVCANEIHTLEVARCAVVSMNTCSPEIVNDVLSMRIYETIWNNLIEIIDAGNKPNSVDIPSDWVEWLKRLNVKGQWSSALDVAQIGSLEWDSKALLNDQGKISLMESLLLETRSTDANAILMSAIPLMLECFSNDEVASNNIKPIYIALLYTLSLMDDISVEALVLIHEIVVMILDIGTSPSEYDDMIKLILEIWENVDSPKNMGWILDVFDMLIYYPSANQNKRDILFSRLCVSVKRWQRRMKNEEWMLFEVLCADINQSDVFRMYHGPEYYDCSTSSSSLSNRLSDMKISVYTLTDAVGKRIKGILESQFPGLRVDISSDKVGNARLKALAREADIFIIATKSAKHAATVFIENNLSIKTVALYPKGKGSSSMLQVFYEHIACL